MQTPLTTVRAVCPHDCPDTCGLVVTVEDGRASSFAATRSIPSPSGFLCQKVSHYLERVYHRDRLLYPMMRIGPKGAGQFERISWDEAIRHHRRPLPRLPIRADGPQAILPYSYAGTMGKLHDGEPRSPVLPSARRVAARSHHLRHGRHRRVATSRSAPGR